MKGTLARRIDFRVEPFIKGRPVDLVLSMVLKCFVTSFSVKGLKVNLASVWTPGSGQVSSEMSNLLPMVAKKEFSSSAHLLSSIGNLLASSSVVTPGPPLLAIWLSNLLKVVNNQMLKLVKRLRAKMLLAIKSK